MLGNPKINIKLFSKIIGSIYLPFAIISCAFTPHPTEYLSTYPPSGKYYGFGYSEKFSQLNNEAAISRIIVKGDTATVSLENNVGIVTIVGKFQLNSNTCFYGEESMSNQQSSFELTNCYMNDGVFNGTYKTGFGDNGSFSATLQQN